MNDEFAKWLQAKYGEHAKVKCHRGDRHIYLGMVFNYSHKGKFRVDMSEYIKNMVDNFPIKFKKTNTALSPAADNLFSEGQGRKLDDKCKGTFHT